MFCLLGIPVRCFVAERDDFEPSLAPPSAPPPPAARPPAGIGHHPWKSAITKDLNHANTNISLNFLLCVCVFFFMLRSFITRSLCASRSSWRKSLRPFRRVSGSSSGWGRGSGVSPLSGDTAPEPKVLSGVLTRNSVKIKYKELQATCMNQMLLFFYVRTGGVTLCNDTLCNQRQM